jgi:hypothetical protein
MNGMDICEDGQMNDYGCFFRVVVARNAISGLSGRRVVSSSATRLESACLDWIGLL